VTRAWARAALALWAVLAAVRPARAQDELPVVGRGADLCVGHWIVAKGALDERGRLAVEDLEVGPPGEQEVLIGTVGAEFRDPERFKLLGQEVHTSEKTEWNGLARGSLAGQRVKVEGTWKGWRNLSARDVSPRDAGRDRVEGRVESVTREGGRLSVAVMSVELSIDPELDVAGSAPLDQIPLAPPRFAAGPPPLDEDDDVGSGLRLAEGLVLAGRVEGEGTREQDFDLDETDDQDRSDAEAALRLRLSWIPRDGLFGQPFEAVVEGRQRWRWREDEADGFDFTDPTTLGETWVRFTDLGGSGWGVQAGRMQFKDRRRWIYRENLDGLRVSYERPGLALEAAAVTKLAIDPSSSPYDEDTDNLLLYLSNGDDRRHLGAWVVDRRDQTSAENSPIWFGARALGSWVADHKLWVEAAARFGFRDDEDLRGWAVDVGSTWTPDRIEPWSVTAGFAMGSGDGDPADGEDEAFRQTGFHDNQAKFAGVTTFRYYGELADPELSNLQILTLGVGYEWKRARTSLDVVAHAYRQDVVQAGGLVSELDAQPDGSDGDLGWELDLVFGSRRWPSADLELVGAWFDPGPAFADQDPAWLARAQLRARF
jgi:alginate production protein